MKAPKLSIIIPCFNEESNILNTHKRLSGVIKKATKNYELLFIDDASTDKTLSILKTLIKKDPHRVFSCILHFFGTRSVPRKAVRHFFLEVVKVFVLFRGFQCVIVHR